MILAIVALSMILHGGRLPHSLAYLDAITDTRLQCCSESRIYIIILNTQGGGSAVLIYRDYCKYDPYGKVTILAPDGVTVRATSAIGNEITYTGRRRDAETGLYYFRNRYYSGDLGRFVSRDPAGYPAGFNLLSSYFAVNSADPLGLFDVPTQARPPVRPSLPPNFPTTPLPPNIIIPGYIGPISPVYQPTIGTPLAPPSYTQPPWAPNPLMPAMPSIPQGNVVYPGPPFPGSFGIDDYPIGDDPLGFLAAAGQKGFDFLHEREQWRKDYKCNNKNECQGKWVTPKGNHKPHNAFVKKIQNRSGDYELTNPKIPGREGTCIFDGLMGRTLFDAKTGHRWMNLDYDDIVKNPVLLKMFNEKWEQAQRCFRIATSCGYNFHIYVDNDDALNGFKKHFYNGVFKK